MYGEEVSDHGPDFVDAKPKKKDRIEDKYSLTLTQFRITNDPADGRGENKLDKTN